MKTRLMDAMKNYWVRIFLVNGALLIYYSLCWSKKKMGRFILKILRFILIWTLKMLKTRNNFKIMWKVNGRRDCFPFKRRANEDSHKNMFVQLNHCAQGADKFELCIVYRWFVGLKCLKNWYIIINYMTIKVFQYLSKSKVLDYRPF